MWKSKNASEAVIAPLKGGKGGVTAGKGRLKKLEGKWGNKLRKNGDYGGLMPSGEAAEWRRFRRAENSFFHQWEPVGQAEWKLTTTLHGRRNKQPGPSEESRYSPPDGEGSRRALIAQTAHAENQTRTPKLNIPHQESD